MTGVSRRQVLAGASVGLTASVAGCTALGSEDPSYSVERVSVDGPDDLGCLDSVSINRESETVIPPLKDEYFTVDVSLVDGYGWATVIAEFGDRFDDGTVEKTVGNGDGSVSFDVGKSLPSLIRLSVECSDGEDVNAVFRVVES